MYIYYVSYLLGWVGEVMNGQSTCHEVKRCVGEWHVNDVTTHPLNVMCISGTICGLVQHGLCSVKAGHMYTMRSDRSCKNSGASGHIKGCDISGPLRISHAHEIENPRHDEVIALKTSPLPFCLNV